MTHENAIIKTKNILIDLSEPEGQTADLQYFIKNFCGVVVKNVAEIQGDIIQKRVYVCGNLENLENVNTPG